MGALQHRPEALRTVGMDIAPDVLLGAVVDYFVRIRKGLIDQRIVGVDLGVRGHVGGDEAVYGRLVGAFDLGREPDSYPDPSPPRWRSCLRPRGQ